MRICAFVLAALLFGLAPAQEWTGPHLVSESLGGIKPTTCKDWLSLGHHETCVIWQYYNGTRWILASRMYHDPSGWGNAVPVAYREEAVNPSMAGATDPYQSAIYCCVWEQRDDTCGFICFASRIFEVWQDEMFVGECINTDGDSAWPSVVVISNGPQQDTVWVAWTNHDSTGWYVSFAHGELYGDWVPPSIAVSGPDPIRHARLGRGHLADSTGCPLLVWETNGDIFYSEYVDSAWQAPNEVAHSDSFDRNPDIINYSHGLGPWITWESTRDGETAVYGTAEDSFSLGLRWCDSTVAGNNYEPCGTAAGYPKKGPIEWSAVAWVSDRDGDPNIYARTRFAEDEVRLDNDTASDVHPAVATFGLTLHWCLWQSNRGGNWNIWGSLMDATGVEEGDSRQPARVKREPTVISGVLVMGLGNRTSASSSPSWLLDAAGRKVVELHAGTNDVSRLAPGVYFVHEAQAQAQAVRKVVIQR